jgi:hypothetical protein
MALHNILRHFALGNPVSVWRFLEAIARGAHGRGYDPQHA